MPTFRLQMTRNRLTFYHQAKLFKEHKQTILLRILRKVRYQASRRLRTIISRVDRSLGIRIDNRTITTKEEDMGIGKIEVMETKVETQGISKVETKAISKVETKEVTESSSVTNVEDQIILLDIATPQL